jgi:hypothetical protein
MYIICSACSMCLERGTQRAQRLVDGEVGARKNINTFEVGVGYQYNI